MSGISGGGPRSDAGARALPAGTTVHAVVLAAGLGTRMAGGVKLTMPVGGRPMIAHVVAAALGSRASGVTVVLGHAADAVRAAAGDRVRFVAAADHARGIAASLRAGIAAVPAGDAGALVCLGDMPLVTAAVLDALIDAAAPGAIVVPVHGGRRGNPVLWGRRFFPALMALTGDVGGRVVMAAEAAAVREVAVGSDEVLLDADTPEGLSVLAGRLGAV